ncbi:response regulator [Agrobacterium rosae]|uniref:Response regulator n=1 Tax=Agrobacterium rosae TaxID=1972867 RepID=A0AAW9FC99_9HYPH|nr:response regulator [Agrobacterium rosae]MDX8302974.1 response regulator [Agrobacterium rosae]POO56535.1 two-component system response regulator [Agrobacterium rosae]
MKGEEAVCADIYTAVLDAVCDSISSALIIYDRDDHIVFVNRRVLSYLPVCETKLTVGTRLRDFLASLYDGRKTADSDLLPRGVERDDWVAEQLSSHWKERSETVEQRAGGRWLRLVKRRFPSGLGICVVSDISEQKKREDQWRSDIERVQLTEEILDTLPLSIFVKDRDTYYVAVNKAGCALLETSADLILGRTVSDIHAEPLASRIDAMDQHVLETGTPAILPERVTRLTGEEVLVITRKQRVGKPGRYFLVTTMDDVTTFATADADGKGVIRGLEHMSFTPSSYLEDEHHQSSQILTGRSILLVTPNDHLGDVARKKMVAVGVDCAVAQSQAEMKAFIEFAASANVRIDLVIVDVQLDIACLDLPQTYGLDAMTADDFQLESSLINQMTRHFRNKHQAPSSTQADGSLEICTGSTPPSTKKTTLDVLVVEDNNINQIVFSQILESLGLSYKIAATGKQALQLFEQEKPSFVLMDTTLPDFDGFEATRRLRKIMGAERVRTPVIGVVSLAFEGDRQACLDAGMDDMLLKPVSPDMVEILLKRYLPESQHRIRG